MSLQILPGRRRLLKIAAALRLASLAPPPMSRRATTSSRAGRTAFWGANHARLLTAEERYDPEGLFFMHHGPGSERRSADGLTR